MKFRLHHYLRHYFLPHHTNNHRPKVLHNESLLVLAVVFLVGALTVTTVRNMHQQVLGAAINIATEDLLQLTNQQREKYNQPPLVMNDELTKAAQLKAADMFAKNYWAHNSPTGEMPWDFIKDAGYDYQYAGENLARGFTAAPSVITAWMNSPEHRANVLSPNYHDVGFAIKEGPLTGERDTVLIVEELGSTPQNVPAAAQKTLAADDQQALQNVVIANNPAVDTRSLTENLSLGFLIMLIAIFVLDILIVERKKVVRFVGHNLDHIMFLCTVGLVVFLLQIGAIL